MAAPDPIDNYFTRAIVGSTVLAPMGASESSRSLPEQGQWLEAGRSRARLAGLAMSSLLGREPGDSSLGEPVSPLALARMRWWLLLAGLAAWSAALWLAFSWLHR